MSTPQPPLPLPPHRLLLQPRPPNPLMLLPLQPLHAIAILVLAGIPDAIGVDVALIGIVEVGAVVGARAARGGQGR